MTLRHTTDRRPRTLRPKLPAVREVRSLGSFENVTEIGIDVQTFHGTADVVGFRVLRLPEGVPNLVIDVAHADA